MSRKNLLSIVLFVILIITGACNNNGGMNNDRPKSPEELRQELLIQEQNSPKTYLSHNGNWRKNILGEMVLEGDISNSATLANFKDAQIEVVWLSKTDTEIKTAYYTIYDFFNAGKTTHYKIKVDAPAATQGVRIGVHSAVVSY